MNCLRHNGCTHAIFWWFIIPSRFDGLLFGGGFLLCRLVDGLFVIALIYCVGDISERSDNHDAQQYDKWLFLHTAYTRLFLKKCKLLVPRAGFEPATLGLEVLCSIQLSYRGILYDYIISTPGAGEGNLLY